MFSNHEKMSTQQINDEMSNLLDYSLKETKKFIKDYLERVSEQRSYQEKAKKVMQ